MSGCGSCGAELLWLRTTRGKSMPVDPTPVPGGNLLVDRDAGTVEVVHNDARKAALERGEPLHVSHFTTCPKADQHRRSGGR